MMSLVSAYESREEKEAVPRRDNHTVTDARARSVAHVRSILVEVGVEQAIASIRREIHLALVVPLVRR